MSHDTYIDKPTLHRISDGTEIDQEVAQPILEQLAENTGLCLNDLYEMTDSETKKLLDETQALSCEHPIYYFEIHGDDSDSDESKWTAWIYQGQMELKYITIVYPKMSPRQIQRMAKL